MAGMLDLADCRIFATVAELKSITAAARKLRVTKSSVSRSLAKLEASLGASLLYRTTRQVALTDTGLMFQQHCIRILGDVQEAEAAVSSLQAAPRGHLRVKAPVTFGQSFLGPLLADFLVRYSKLTVELQLEGRSDPDAGGVDVEIRVGRLADSSLIARRLASVPLHLCAGSAYAMKYGLPSTPGELVSHALIAATAHGQVWNLEKANGKKLSIPVAPRLVVDDPGTVREAVLAGAGLGWVPEPLSAKEVAAQRMVYVDLAGWVLPQTEIHALFPGNRNITPKVRVFVDFLVEKFGR